MKDLLSHVEEVGVEEWQQPLTESRRLAGDLHQLSSAVP